MKIKLNNYFLILLVIIFIVTLGCSKESDKIMNENLFDLKSDKIIQVKLSNQLKEISGLASSNDGRIFGHDDEEGVIHQIDPSNGEIVKRFQLGDFGIEAKDLS